MLIEAVVVCVTALAPQEQAGASVWPPTGPKWETDPALALERAREEQKPVVTYVASAT